MFFGACEDCSYHDIECNIMNYPPEGLFFNNIPYNCDKKKKLWELFLEFQGVIIEV